MEAAECVQSAIASTFTHILNSVHLLVYNAPNLTIGQIITGLFGIFLLIALTIICGSIPFALMYEKGIGFEKARDIPIVMIIVAICISVYSFYDIDRHGSSQFLVSLLVSFVFAILGAALIFFGRIGRRVKK